MGCDGGVIAVQRRFMRGVGQKKKAQNYVDPRIRNLMKSQTCALTNEYLQQPIVADKLGNLFNKEALLDALFQRTLNPAFRHIRGLKDIVECKLTPNPIRSPSEANNEEKKTEGDYLSSDYVPQFICPIAIIEMNGYHPFVVIWSNGWVISEKAIKEMGIDSLQTEYGPFTKSDIMKLIPSEEEYELLRQELEQKQQKKKRKRDERPPIATTESKESNEEKIVSEKDLKKRKKSSKENESHEKSFQSTKIIEEAKEIVKKNQHQSEVFSSIFSSKNDATHANTLFMNASGLRYNLN